MQTAEWEIHQGDIGTVIEVTIVDNAGDAIDISSATTKQIVFRLPNGTNLTKTAAFSSDGKDGKIRYTTVSGDLKYVGWWEAQGRIAVGATQDWRSEIVKFEVQRNVD